MFIKENRIEWIDQIRGMAIILMLLGHALQFEGAPAGYDLGVRFIYLFHMPLFFMISGILLGFRIPAEKGSGVPAMAKKKTILKKLVSLGIPYILFSVIYIAFKLSLRAHVQTNAVVEGTGAIWKILWNPVGQYWFLEALLIFETAAVALSDRPKRYTVLMPFLVLGFLINGSGLTDGLVRKASIFAGILNNAFAFNGGILIAFLLKKREGARVINGRFSAKQTAATLVWNAGFAAAALWYVSLGSGKSAGDAVIRLVLCVAGVLACSGLVILVVRSRPVGSALSWLGQESWYIFLVHSYFTAAGRAGMHRLGIHSAPAILAVEMAAGIAGPWLVHAVSRRVKWMDFLFYPAKYIGR